MFLTIFSRDEVEEENYEDDDQEYTDAYLLHQNSIRITGARHFRRFTLALQMPLNHFSLLKSFQKGWQKKT